MANGYDINKVDNQQYVNGIVLEKLHNIEKNIEAKEVVCSERRKEIDSIKKTLYIGGTIFSCIFFFLLIVRDVLVDYIAKQFIGG